MTKNRVLLTILPLFWPKMPPIGLGYLQSYLAQNGLDAAILDLNNIFYNLSDEGLKKQWQISCNAVLEDNILTFIKNNHPGEFRAAIERMLDFEFIAFSCFKSNFAATLEAVKLLKSRSKEVKIILGGPEITRQFFKAGGKFNGRLKDSADFLVVGEGEKPLCDYLKGSKKKEKTAAFEQLEDLDKLPFPKYPGLDFLTYPRKDAMPLQFSRGCIRRCGFCSERLLYKGFRRRSVESMIDEIRYHKVNNRTDYFVFFDSLINADLRALEDLCDKIIGDFGSINWEAQIAVRKDMRQGIFDKMKRSGCYNLFVGLESGSDSTLKLMNKGFSAKDAENFFRQLHSSGLSFGVSIIVGYPGESDSGFRENLDFLISHKEIIPKIEQANPFTYYDGTIADRKADYKINKLALERLEVFVREIKRNSFKHTNAFLGNLIEKDGGI